MCQNFEFLLLILLFSLSFVLQAFDRFPSAEALIVVEDDLEISPDFFHYFLATYHLLLRDPSLYCVSAWNDNGKEGLIDKRATSLLYRSDFFPGLGWMLKVNLEHYVSE